MNEGEQLHLRDREEVRTKAFNAVSSQVRGLAWKRTQHLLWVSQTGEQVRSDVWPQAQEATHG